MSDREARRRSTRGTAAVIGLVTLLLGTALGAAIGTGTAGTGTPRPAPTATVTLAPAPADEACLRAADAAERVADHAAEAAEAAADLDARRLEEIVASMQDEDAAVRAARDRCRAGAPASPGAG